MNDVDGQASLTPIVWTGSDGLGELQAHLGSERQDADTWYSAGLALLEAGRHEEAATAFHAALTLHPHSLAIESAYATALGSLGATHQAASLLEDIIHRNPGDGWAYFHLAALRYRQGDCELASQLWETAARLVDDPMDSLENLAMVRRRLGQVEDERGCWQRAAQHDPTNPMALHMLAAVGLTPTPPRADGAYVTCMFDRFAPDFDRVLAQLQYHVPDLCEEWMHDQCGPPGRCLRVLDAGCGTGLCGARLRPWAAELVGVDLSARMLEHAARRGVYERLERADLIEFLRANRGGFDVVVAGDVLCYFGDLGPFAQCALASLRAEGLLGFSVERAGEDELGDREESGYIIRHHGRYAHTCRHIKHAFRGGTLHLAEVALRLELGEAVGGYWVSAKRKGHARTIATRDAILDQLNAPDKKTQFAALEKVEYVGDRSLVKNVARLLDDPAPVTVWVAGGPHQVVLRLNDAAAKVIAVLLRQPFSFQLSSYRPCTDAEIQEIKAYLQSHRLLP